MGRKYGSGRRGSGTNPCTTTCCLIGNIILLAILSSTTLFYAHRQLGEHREPTAGCAPDAWGVLRNHNGLLCDQLPQSVKTQLEATKGLPRKLREQSYRAIPIPHKTAHDHAGDSMGASLMRARLDAKEARKKKLARRDARIRLRAERLGKKDTKQGRAKDAAKHPKDQRAGEASKDLKDRRMPIDGQKRDRRALGRRRRI